ncbi:MAG: Ltp family lipoprotein [Corynebacterium sp.]|uniref:Ltp family lipoprotein n=1 Tax=Corynebacterium sp. TaxID=1720 RepID=UPI003F9B59B9
MSTQNTQAGQPIQQPETTKKPFYKKAWFIILVIVLVIIVAVNMGGGEDDDTSASEATLPAASTPAQLEQDEAGDTADDTVADGQDVPEQDAVEPPAPSSDEVPREFRSALSSAETYSEMMHMSKAGIYDQLTSEYGGQFTAEAAQYAIDNIDADWNNNALESARTYQDTMNMSPAAIHDQLTSEYGGQFTAEEADFAIGNL